MEILIALAVGIVGSLVAAEIYAHANGIGHWLIAMAVRQLPEAARAEYSEAWLSHLDELPGCVRKIWHAADCLLRAAPGVRRERARLDHKKLERWIRVAVYFLTIYAALRSGTFLTWKQRQHWRALRAFARGLSRVFIEQLTNGDAPPAEQTPAQAATQILQALRATPRADRGLIPEMIVADAVRSALQKPGTAPVLSAARVGQVFAALKQLTAAKNDQKSS